MKYLFPLLLILSACRTPEEEKAFQADYEDRQNGSPIRFRNLTQNWCKQLYNTECPHVCKVDVWLKADCDVMVNGQMRHLKCDYNSCLEK